MKPLPDWPNINVLKRWFIQAVFIVLVTLLSILAVTWILEKSLVGQALELEADAFIESYRHDRNFPLPRTRNLIGYMSTPQYPAELPGPLTGLMPGLYPAIDLTDRENGVPVYVRDFDGNRLYLVFEGANLDRLVGIFGLLPLSILLILIYTSSWIAYLVSTRAVSPILRIARLLRETDPDKSPLNLTTKNLTGEAKELAVALEQYASRIDAFVERERQFTADVSHELRTPVTIIDGAAQFLAAEKNLSSKSVGRVQMIRRACRDVSELITAFLFLAREQEQHFEGKPTRVASIAESEVIKLYSLVDESKVVLVVDIQDELFVPTQRKVLEIILGNLCGNAAKYTETGEIRVTVTDRDVMVSDTGVGIPEDLLPHLFERHVRGRGLQQAGEGIGLAIVKRLCDQFGWTIKIENRPQGGVLATLTRPSWPRSV